MLIFLALFTALRRYDESLVVIGTTLALASTILFIAPNPAFAMLSLSSQYAAATTDVERTMFLTAGQALPCAVEMKERTR